MERLSSRIEHLKSQNEVLTLTLTESKNHCDNLTVLIGKYESNHTGYSLSEAFILASINPKYDSRLFIELQAQYEKTSSSVHVVLTFTTIRWTQHDLNW